MLWFIVLLTVTVTNSTFLKPNNGKPNIIVIIADDLGWNDLSFHGSDQIATPNIDALGYHGVIFNRFYAQPSCTPSRAAFLTGKYPIRFGYQGFPLDVSTRQFIPHNVETLPKSLQKLGYKTHLIGKWHLGYSKKDATPLGYGYDTHYGYWNGYMGYFFHDISGGHQNGTDLHDQLDPVLDESGEYATDLFTKRAVKIINGHPKNQPLHLVISHLAGHTGATVSSAVKTVLEVHNETETNQKYSFIKNPERRKLAEIVENMDKSVGDVIEALAKKDLLQNSVIVFFSDNGAATYDLHANYGSNYPLRGIKTTMYEGAVRVPALIYSPYIKNKGRIFDGVFHISDWVPTLLKAAGGNVNSLGRIDGVNQWRNINTPLSTSIRRRQEVLIEIDPTNECGALIDSTGRYKLINNSHISYDFTGDSGFTMPYLNYVRVKNSKTNRYLENVNHEKLTQYRVDKLRTQIRIQCSAKSNENQEKLRKNIKPCTGICLYDLWKDPCEYEDVADQHPTIVERLFSKLETLQSEAVSKIPISARFYDLAGDPKLCNNTWFNWLDDDGCYLNRKRLNAVFTEKR